MDALPGHGSGPTGRYVAPAPLLHFLAPLDVAPFRLYLPLVFLATLRLGAHQRYVQRAALPLSDEHVSLVVQLRLIRNRKPAIFS